MMKVRKPSENEIKLAQTWDTWSKEVSEFDWYYDEKEICFIIEGKASVKDQNGNKIEFGSGDWVEFEKGLSCTWTIFEKIKKKYFFG